MLSKMRKTEASTVGMALISSVDSGAGDHRCCHAGWGQTLQMRRTELKRTESVMVRVQGHTWVLETQNTVLG